MKRAKGDGSKAGAVASVAVLAAIFFLLNLGCSVLHPLPRKTSVGDRIAALPTRNAPVAKPVTIYWDQHMIPFIEAQTDEDAAIALGMVHAHLRLGQMEILRHASQGRLSEMAGPFARKIDASLRILDVGRCSKAIYGQMPPETKAWLDNFVRGINFVQDNMADLPHEFKVCAFKREPWKPEDIITIARLGGLDVNWLQLFSLLPKHSDPSWPQFWAERLRTGLDSPPSISPADVMWPVGGMVRSGSNSFVISGKRRGGAAIIASDPHLGIMIPSIWLLVGIKSPSYHTVGLMFVGVPFIALGRNERIAWGGTNMHSASSDIYDVSKEPAENITTRKEKIKVRWWFDRTVSIRESRLGPILSDTPLLSAYKGPPLAVHWVGHEPSDEFTAMLRATRARDWAEFRSAFAPYALPGMNILYADVDGNIGQLMAVKLPMRQKQQPDDLVLDPQDPANLWRGLLDPTQLPCAFNPKEGFLVSCNNLPVKMSPPVGYFFPKSDRFLRISSLLRENARPDLPYAERTQQDVYSAADVASRDQWVKDIAQLGLAAALAKANPAFLPALTEWNGEYTADSLGAVAYQMLAYEIGAKPLSEDAAIGAAKEFDRFKTWGEMHRLRIAHLFGSVPILGRRYRFGDYPTAGSRETVWKTSHQLTNQRNTTGFGSTARHISDLSDLDENYFTLPGGEDGWINSAASLDQVPIWLKGEYIRVPLRIENVARAFEYKSSITPGSGADPNSPAR